MQRQRRKKITSQNSNDLEKNFDSEEVARALLPFPADLYHSGVLPRFASSNETFNAKLSMKIFPKFHEIYEIIFVSFMYNMSTRRLPALPCFTLSGETKVPFGTPFR